MDIVCLFVFSFFLKKWQFMLLLNMSHKTWLESLFKPLHWSHESTRSWASVSVYNLPFWSSQHHLVSGGKVVCLQCKSYKFGPLVWWDTTCNFISHVCVFLITRPLVHHKNNINSVEARLWKNISHQTLQWKSYNNSQGFHRESRNEISIDKLVFGLTFLISLINQKLGDENNINTWHQEPHFIPYQKPTLQALTLLQTCSFAPLTRWRHDLWKGICTRCRKNAAAFFL